MFKAGRVGERRRRVHECTRARAGERQGAPLASALLHSLFYSALSTHSTLSAHSTHSTRSSGSFFFSLCSLYVKALFRRGSALAKSADYAAARADLLAASKLDPKSKEIREAFTACKEAEAAAKAKDKAFAAKMFG